MQMIERAVGGTATCNAPVNYAELVDRCMDSVELAEQILGRFEQCFATDLAELLDAFHCQDRQRLVTVAHRLKGASANVSATGLMRIASELEQFGRSWMFDELSPWVNELQSEWTCFQQRPPLREAVAAALD